MAGPPFEYNRMAVFVFTMEGELWNGKIRLRPKK